LYHRSWTEEWGHVIELNRAFDSDSRLTALEHIVNGESVLSYSYGHDDNSNITSIQKSFNGVVSQDLFSYDHENRLLGRSGSQSESFSMDLLGNMLNNNRSYNELNQIVEDDENVYTHDLHGNLVQIKNKASGKTSDYFWSVENKLKEIRIKNDGVNDSYVLSMEYDALGRRIYKSVQDVNNSANSFVRKYLYNGSDILLELDGENNIITSYINGPSIDDVQAMVRPNDRSGFDMFYFLKDHLGSVSAIMDSDNNLIQSYEYSSYGVPTMTVAEGKTAIENSKQYTAREYDSLTGDYFYRARYYNPSTGRFLSVDPIGFGGQDSNLYRYVGNNPVNFYDPYGLLKYNTTDESRTGRLSGETLDFANCMEKCVGSELMVTGGSEKKYHGDKSKHYTGQACDFSKKKNPQLNHQNTSACFSSCAKSNYYGQFETNPDHYHFQIVPGKNNSTGFYY